MYVKRGKQVKSHPFKLCTLPITYLSTTLFVNQTICPNCFSSNNLERCEALRKVQSAYGTNFLFDGRSCKPNFLFFGTKTPLVVSLADFRHWLSRNQDYTTLFQSFIFPRYLPLLILSRL